MKEVKNFLIQAMNSPFQGDVVVDMSGSPRFDDQTSRPDTVMDPRCACCPSVEAQYFRRRLAGATSNLDNNACLLDPPLVLWDKITQRNCIVLDCFSSRVFENTTYYRLQGLTKVFWRRDDQVEEAHE